MVLLHRIHAPCHAAHRIFQRGGGIIGFQAADQGAQGAFNAVQAPFQRRIGILGLQPLQRFFDMANGAVRFGVALLQLGLVAGANTRLGFQPFQRMIQGIGVELCGLFHRRNALVQRGAAGLRGGFDRGQALIEGAGGFRLESGETAAGILFDFGKTVFQAAGGAFDVAAHLAQPSGHLLQSAGDNGGLLGRLGGGLGDLVGKARKALMQRLDRILQAVLGLAAFQPVADIHDMATQLIEGLGLFAGGDVDFRGGLVHRPVVFRLAAFRRVQPAPDGAQMFFDTAIGFRGFGFCPADAGQHVLAVAAAGRAGRQAPGIQIGAIKRCAAIRRALIGTVIGHGRCLFARIRKTAQNAARQPFPDRQSLAPGSGARGFPRFWRDAGYIPGKLCSHLESIAPHTRYRRYRGQDIV